MFKDKLPLADVAIELEIGMDTVLSYYKDYLRLVRTNGFMSIFEPDLFRYQLSELCGF